VSECLCYSQFAHISKQRKHRKLLPCFYAEFKFGITVKLRLVLFTYKALTELLINFHCEILLSILSSLGVHGGSGILRKGRNNQVYKTT
jgi:hypothetical protein